MTRFLVWLDYDLFGARNVSLFVELYAVQLVAFGLLALAIERSTALPVSLRRTLQGIFAFCLFHPNQAENLTWAFQVSFVFCFMIGTATLLAVVSWNILPDRLRRFATGFVALAPLLAAINLSGGLLIGPVAIIVAIWKRLPRTLIAVWSAMFTFTFAAYCIGHQSEGGSLLASLSHPVGVAHYVFRYFDASWQLMIPLHSDVPAILALVLLTFVGVGVVRERRSRFEMFCVAQCGLIVLTAFVTALGRYHFGIEQAAASRYQTPAMLFWACLASLVLVRYWTTGSASVLGKTVAVVMLAGWLFFPAYWVGWTLHHKSQIRACSLINSDGFTATAAGVLHPRADVLRSGADLLSQKWR